MSRWAIPASSIWDVETSAKLRHLSYLTSPFLNCRGGQKCTILTQFATCFTFVLMSFKIAAVYLKMQNKNVRASDCHMHCSSLHSLCCCAWEVISSFSDTLIVFLTYFLTCLGERVVINLQFSGNSECKQRIKIAWSSDCSSNSQLVWNQRWLTMPSLWVVSSGKAELIVTFSCYFYCCICYVDCCAGKVLRTLM